MIGWGAQVQGGGLAETLTKARVNTVTNDECKAVMGAAKITEKMICAGEEKTDTCQVSYLIYKAECPDPMSQGLTY